MREELGRTCGLKKDNKKTQRIAFVIAALIVFLITSYALVISAFTLENDEKVLVCSIEEHEHDKSCIEVETLDNKEITTAVEQNDDEQVEKIVCGKEAHIHSESCYEDKKDVSSVPEKNTTDKEQKSPNEVNSKPKRQQILKAASLGGTVSAQSELDGEENQLDPEPEEPSPEPEEPGPEEPGPDEPDSTVNLTMEDAITELVIKYKRLDSNGEYTGNWETFDSGTTVFKGNELIRFEASYEKLSTQAIKDNNYAVTYTLPDILKGMISTGIIDQNKVPVGQIDVTAETATITFHENWLDNRGESISGDFHFDGKLKLKDIGDDDPLEIVIGDINVPITLEEDFFAKSADISIAKDVENPKLEQTSEGDFLCYKIEVEAGEDGCPNVKVKDKVTTHAEFVDSYYGITETSTSISNIDNNKVREEISFSDSSEATCSSGNVYQTTSSGSKILVYEIGDMKPYEIRTLYYKVKLTENYAGVKVENGNRNISNKAEVYSVGNSSGNTEYLRDDDSANFVPKAGVDMSKKSASYVANDDGVGGRITYYVWVKANDNNSYNLDGVSLTDRLDANGAVTDANLRPFLSVDLDSVKVYQGGSKDMDSLPASPVQIESGNKATALTGGAKGFKYTFSTPFEPGEGRFVSYDLIVDPEYFAVTGNNDKIIRNRAEIYTKDNKWIQGYNSNHELDHYKWSEKSVSEQIKEAKDIDMGTDTVFVKNESSYVTGENPGEFNVPEGCYKYVVELNKPGFWDVTSSNLSDRFENQSHMEYVGWVRIDSFDSLHDENQKTPIETLWVEVDGDKQFDFTLASLGLTDESNKKNCSYKLTYYARPVNLDDVTQIVVKNNFTMGGQVGIGGNSYQIIGIRTSAQMVVEGMNTMDLDKIPWYYDKDDTNGGTTDKGALYWMIKVTGNKIPENTIIRETKGTGGEGHNITADSIVGVYFGNINQTLDNYKTFDEFEEDNAGLEVLNVDEDYEISVPAGGNNTTVDIKMIKAVVLQENEAAEAKELYIVVKSFPTRLPGNKRDVKTYNNNVQSSGDDGTNFVDYPSASQNIFGSENLIKEMGAIISVTKNATGGKDYEILKKGSGVNTMDRVYTDDLDAGTYIAWAIKPNYMGNLSGEYFIVDDVPEGLSPEYLRLKWYGGAYSTSDYPKLVEVTGDSPFASMVSGWEKKTISYRTDNSGTNVNSTYYISPDGKKIGALISDLKAGNGNINDNNNKDRYAVDLQVLFRVTDTDVVLGISNKAFDNSASIYDKKLQKIGTDRDLQTITKQKTLVKGTTRVDNDGASFPFVITVNANSEDLIPGADTYEVLDKMGESLVFDPSSVEIRDINNQIVPNTKIEYDKENREIIFTVPDNKKITITYTAKVNVAPNTKVDISNVASYRGYGIPDSGILRKDDFEYSSGGSVTPDETPKIRITKHDAGDVQTTLNDAKFNLCEVNNDLTDKVSPVIIDGKTSGDGTLVFGGDDNPLKYDTIYKVWETEAPEGYITDTTPVYIVISKPVKNSGIVSYPKYPDGVNVQYTDIEGITYEYAAFNERGKVTIEKSFADHISGAINVIGGTYTFGIFDEEQTESNKGTPLSTITMTLQSGNGDKGTAEFKDLDIRNDYYIYELDSEGKAVLDSEEVEVNNLPFIVTYNDTNSVTSDDVSRKDTIVSVTNTVNAEYMLPETGGTGIYGYIMIGAMLCMVALVMMYIYSRKRRHS